MAKKKNPFDLLAAKEAKKTAEKEAKEVKEAAPKKVVPVVKSVKRVNSKKSVSKNSNNGRKLIRVHNEIHELAKWNNRRMDLSDYVEGLIQIAAENGVDWSELPTIKMTDHKDESKRTLFRVLPQFHELAKFNNRRMKLQDYIEGLVLLDQEGKVDWSKLK